jgi:hypothetical protein
MLRFSSTRNALQASVLKTGIGPDPGWEMSRNLNASQRMGYETSRIAAATRYRQDRQQHWSVGNGLFRSRWACWALRRLPTE